MTVFTRTRGSLRLSAPNPQRFGVDVPPNSGESTADIMDANEALPQVAQALVIGDDGRVLGVSRGHGSDEFTPPGGCVEDGEDPARAAARELEEETGLSAQTLVPLFSRESDGKLVSVFLCDASGKARSSEEGDTRWITPQKLMSGKFGDYYTEMFKSIGM